MSSLVKKFLALFQREQRPARFTARFTAIKQSRPYIHLRPTVIQEYAIFTGGSATDFANLFSVDVCPEYDAVTRALVQYIEETGPIRQSVVVILVGDVWAGQFMMMENSNPNTLVLELQT